MLNNFKFKHVSNNEELYQAILLKEEGEFLIKFEDCFGYKCKSFYSKEKVEEFLKEGKWEVVKC